MSEEKTDASLELHDARELEADHEHFWLFWDAFFKMLEAPATAEIESAVRDSGRRVAVFLELHEVDSTPLLQWLIWPRLETAPTIAILLQRTKSILAAELRRQFRRAKEMSDASTSQTAEEETQKLPLPERIKLDNDTQTVTFDGVEYKVENPKTYELYTVIYGNRPAPLKRAQLQTKVKGCGGDNTIRSLLDSLPGVLAKTIISTGSGYHFNANGQGERRHQKKQPRKTAEKKKPPNKPAKKGHT
jgi:hypothetical protein